MRVGWWVILMESAAVVGVSAQRPLTWTTASKPLFTIGAASADTLQGVLDAALLHDGRIVIVAGRTVRLYSADGKLARMAFWSSGSEPTPIIAELRVSADSFAVVDLAAFKQAWFDTRASPKKAESSEPSLAEAAKITFFHRTMIRSHSEGAMDCARQFLASTFATPSQKIHELVIERSGIWVHEYASPTWTIYEPGGSQVATIMLPPRLTLYSANADRILGAYRGLSRDTVVELRISSTLAEQTYANCKAAVGDDSKAIAAVRRTLYRVLPAAERVRTAIGHYVSTADSLGVVTPPHVRILIIGVGQTGWAGAVLDDESSAACVVGLGDATPPGWGDGIIHCGS